MEENLTLDEAGERLGISRRRVQAMVSSGMLSAEKRGGQWFVASAAVRIAGHNRRAHPGRPLTASTAWDRIERLADDGRLLAAKGQLDDVRKRLRPRARHLSFYVHPGLLADLRRHQAVVLGGRDAIEASVPVDPVDVDLYVKESDAGGVLDEVLARPTSGNANVFAHIVADNTWPFHPGQRHVSPWVAWLDLEDRQDRAAVTLLDQLLGGRAGA